MTICPSWITQRLSRGYESEPQNPWLGLVPKAAPVMLSVQLQSSLMTIALVFDALAVYLTHPLEDADHWYAEWD